MIFWDKQICNKACINVCDIIFKILLITYKPSSSLQNPKASNICLLNTFDTIYFFESQCKLDNKSIVFYQSNIKDNSAWVGIFMNMSQSDLDQNLHVIISCVFVRVFSMFDVLKVSPLTYTTHLFFIMVIYLISQQYLLKREK